MLQTTVLFINRPLVNDDGLSLMEPPPQRYRLRNNPSIWEIKIIFRAIIRTPDLSREALYCGNHSCRSTSRIKATSLTKGALVVVIGIDLHVWIHKNVALYNVCTIKLELTGSHDQTPGFLVIFMKKNITTIALICVWFWYDSMQHNELIDREQHWPSFYTTCAFRLVGCFKAQTNFKKRHLQEL